MLLEVRTQGAFLSSAWVDIMAGFSSGKSLKGLRGFEWVKLRR